MSRITLSISRVHNSSAALFIDKELIFHIENERLSHIKYDMFPFLAMSKIIDYVEKVDNLIICGVSPTVNVESFLNSNVYKSYVCGLGKSFYENEMTVYDLWKNHHKLHASQAFYSSGFKSALCVVKDGMGSDVYLGDLDFFTNDTVGRENGTSFLCSYPNKFEEVEKSILVNFEVPNNKFFIDEKRYVTNSFSEGLAFQKTALNFGFNELDAGKVMGMSSYGKKKKYDILNNGLVSRDIFKFRDNDLRRGYLDLSFSSFDEKIDFAFDLQNQIQESVLNEILNLLEKTEEKNLCLSGGFFLNCVANYYILKNLPKDINIYIEPISSDAGTSIGAAKLFFHSNSEYFENTQKNIYFGPINKNTDLKKIKEQYSNNEFISVNNKNVANLIFENNIVAIFQGRSESGPRALGNRSILYNPCNEQGKDFVNRVKKREWFRPFAGSVLVEEAKNWFDIDRLDDSPFMMYAVDVLEEKKIIPAITHVDGTCRIQTVSKNQNPVFYNLINEFYKISSVPIIFNTSFNLAGDTMVESIEDAINTLNKSEIDYLYLPELGVIVR